MKVRQNRLPECRVGIAKVIVAYAIVDREPACDLPDIFNKRTSRALGKAIIVGEWLPCDWIESNVGFCEWIVIDEIDDVGIGKDRLAVSAREVRQVISMPAFIANLEIMMTPDVGNYVPPAGSVLNIILVWIGGSPANTQIGHIDHWHCEQALIGRVSFKPVVANESFIQQVI